MFDRRYPRMTLALTLAALALGASRPGPATAETPPSAPPPPPESPAPAPKQEAPEHNYKVQVNGLFDGYYMYQFRNPRFKDTINNIGGARTYDVRHDAPTLALAELNVFKDARPGGFGFHSTLIAGDAADVNHANFPPGPMDGKGETRYKNIQQLFATYAFDGAGGGVDFGKYYTPFGYELVENTGNYNYSRSLPFFLLPAYNFGFRFYTPSMKGLVATGYVVNTIINTASAGVRDDNGHPSYIGQLTYTDPKGKLSAITTMGFGKDRIDGTDNNVAVNDTDFTYNLNANRLVGLNYMFMQEKPEGGDRTTTHGYAAYFHQVLTPRTAFALRYSGYRLRTIGSPASRPNEVTVTYEIKPLANLITRFEYRHDWANQPMYLDHAAQPTEKSEDTFTVGAIYSF